MAAIKFYLSTKKGKSNEKPIFVDIVYRDGEGRIHKRLRTQHTAPADRWNERAQCINIPKLRLTGQTQQRELAQMSDTNKALAALRADIEKALLSGYNETKLQNIVGCVKRIAQAEPQLYEGLADYARDARLAERRKAHYLVVSRMIQRYCEYEGKTLFASSTTIEDINGLERFIESEHTLVDTQQYKKRVQSKSEKIKQRGSNRVVVIMKIVRAYFNHLYKVGAISANPFDKYEMRGEVYGTPYFLTYGQVQQIYNTPSRWQVQKDIFVFQSLTGCRVGDLQRLTWNNVIEQDGRAYITYIPSKTRNESAKALSVPLEPMAVEIIERYKDCKGFRLLPCISQDKYNDNIKRILEEMGLTQMVTIRNPKTGEGEQRRLCDVAGSHMARRNFCGGMFIEGVDSRVICSMSGHAEGSKAFSRYVAVSDEQKCNAIFNRGKQ